MATEVDFDCWEKARIDPDAEFDGPCAVRTVFGYGSLIFRPGFPHVRAYPVCVKGFHRRFWQQSCDHRGTPVAPGRVVTLVREADVDTPDFEGSVDALVHGMAYEVAEPDWPDVLEMLDVRERHGYVRTITDLFPSKSRDDDPVKTSTTVGRAVVYYSHDPTRNAAYVGPEAIEKTAQIISCASGPSGRNDEYLFRLAESLRKECFVEDEYITRLVEEVRRYS